jgi:hypothetical protein
MKMATVNQKIGIQFNQHQGLYTARAGLVPVREVIRNMKIDVALNSACKGMWGEARSENFGFESTGLLMMGLMSGFPRAYQIVNSSEVNFFAKLLNVENISSQSSLSRFISSFEDKNITNLQNLVFTTAKQLDSIRSGGFRILVHDQSAIQKYGKEMEGVEKGYGGTLKRGSLMLQASLVVDGCSSSILAGDIRTGSTHTFEEAATQLDSVLNNLKNEKERTLILADSGYGCGDYIRTAEKHESCFILAIKNDAWLKNELSQEDFKNFRQGVAGEDYGYREFIASRKAWLPDDSKNPLEEGLRVIVVKLPVGEDKDPKFQYLVTNLTNDWNPEDVHQLYKQHRESIEIINDELKNQLGLGDLPSQILNGNRGMAQLVFLSWNIIRIVENIGLKKHRDRENSAREKNEKAKEISEKKQSLREKVQALKGRLQRREWWTLFVRFISTGGKYTEASRQKNVFVSANAEFKEWYDSLTEFDWKKFAVI